MTEYRPPVAGEQPAGTPPMDALPMDALPMDALPMDAPAGDAPPTGEPAADQPATAELSGPGSTGQPAVDAAVQAVVHAATVPPAEQVPAYQAAHRTLRETLASIDEQ